MALLPGELTRLEEVQTLLRCIQADHAQATADLRELVVIPAPPFGEDRRARAVMERLSALGLRPELDSEGNVLCPLAAGRGLEVRTAARHLVLSAHLDTVFPEDTALELREDDAGRLHAPGIADDTRGVAALLSLARCVIRCGTTFAQPVTLAFTVGEEGEGDLRGVKALFRERDDITAFVTVDGTGPGTLITQGIGSRRIRVCFKGPGGHSLQGFGLPSAVHALGRAVASIADLEVPTEPLTTFTVGIVRGGTSVNAIAAEASLLLDLRSVSPEVLAALESRVLALAEEAGQRETQRWNRPDQPITVSSTLIGDRPCAVQDPEEPFIRLAAQSYEALGVAPRFMAPSSTDANLPISLGIPAVTMSAGGNSAGEHSPSEWFDPEGAFQAVQALALLALSYAGPAERGELSQGPGPG